MDNINQKKPDQKLACKRSGSPFMSPSKKPTLRPKTGHEPQAISLDNTQPSVPTSSPSEGLSKPIPFQSSTTISDILFLPQTTNTTPCEEPKSLPISYEPITLSDQNLPSLPRNKTFVHLAELKEALPEVLPKE